MNQIVNISLIKKAKNYELIPTVFAEFEMSRNYNLKKSHILNTQ